MTNQYTPPKGEIITGQVKLIARAIHGAIKRYHPTAHNPAWEDLGRKHQEFFINSAKAALRLEREITVAVNETDVYNAAEIISQALTHEQIPAAVSARDLTQQIVQRSGATTQYHQDRDTQQSPPRNRRLPQQGLSRSQIADFIQSHGLSHDPRSTIHSEQCLTPDRYGQCSCVDEFVEELLNLQTNQR